MERTFYVLAYDIANDKRRARIAKAMESIGERVQGSVFEAYLTAAELEKLLKKAGRHFKPEEDTLRIYALCAGCRGRIGVRGRGRATPPPGLVIV